MAFYPWEDSTEHTVLDIRRAINGYVIEWNGSTYIAGSLAAVRKLVLRALEKNLGKAKAKPRKKHNGRR